MTVRASTLNHMKRQAFYQSSVSPEDVAAHNLAGLSLSIKDYKATAEELGIGEITLRDIVKELEKPARDPRDEMPKPQLQNGRTGNERFKRRNDIEMNGAKRH